MRNKRKGVIRAFVIGIILALALSYIKLPFYITKPGNASELEPIIKVEGGYDSKGSFSLTTVSIGRASIFGYLFAQADQYAEILPMNQVKAPEESDEEYLNRQLKLMEGSQESALILAYKTAGKSVKSEFNGVYVNSVIKEMPAAKVLKPGDRVYEADGKQLKSSEEFVSYVSGKKEGDSVTVSYERNGSRKNANLKIAAFPSDMTSGGKKAGIGVTLMTDREVTVTPKIELDTEDIGGPSAGLMMTLEIFDQLTEKDFTKGYKIAGTGTIAEDGKVGPIGGISQKIVAADQSGADLFFAPNEGGRKGSNYQEAVKTAKDIDTSMKIVPVDEFSDAITYLEKLKAK
ncbi:PDZ domain-containing protein [Bacillus mangrovi]|uniref:endopeptidase La n=1 Tax=Metabacillus mangrovi TaxID=1491830 RepID=A0A7X2S3L9_9BACI|nr:SepM family pheromone-processing serine protease [Metabacillus mangrovi]MTH52615.1 PDZ domain-containing protein [Metabacillus mangrovi]